ncbi:MAG: hypothetical protein ABI999_03985 [Acidobacteriota bacterium]
MRALFLLVILATLSVASCTPNQSIALDKTNDPNATRTRTPEAPPEAPTKITVAELIGRVANAKPESFLFPCTLNAYSAVDRQKLLKLRETWLAKEQDERYLISPSTGCICPSICVLTLEDRKAPPPANSAIILFDQTPTERYVWLAKNLNLTGAQLGWSSITPQITFTQSDGKVVKTCTFMPDKVPAHYVAVCTDGTGKKIAAL